MTDYKSMFEQAVDTLAAIDEALGIADYGCCDPGKTLTAITELKAKVQATQAVPMTDGIRPEDFTVDVVVKPMGGFAPVNTQGVRVTHKPTGISVTCDAARSQHTNRHQAFEKLSAILALAQQPATGEPVACANPDGLKSNWHAHHVIVNKAALQMVRNALRNDVERGLKVRGEMLAELDLATFQAHPAPSVPDDVVRDAKRYEWLRQHQLLAKINYMPTPSGEDLDAAIDASMLAAKEGTNGEIN